MVSEAHHAVAHARTYLRGCGRTSTWWALSTARGTETTVCGSVCGVLKPLERSDKEKKKSRLHCCAARRAERDAGVRTRGDHTSVGGLVATLGWSDGQSPSLLRSRESTVRMHRCGCARDPGLGALCLLPLCVVRPSPSSSSPSHVVLAVSCTGPLAHRHNRRGEAHHTRTPHVSPRQRSKVRCAAQSLNRT